jgi:transposase
LLLTVQVHAADIADREGGKAVLAAVQQAFPTVRHVWVDSAYRGPFVDWVQQTLGWSVTVSRHWWTGVSKVWVLPGQEPPEKPTGFQLLKWRWIVERTLAWIGKYRRFSKDYEYLVETSEAMLYTAMTRTMLARLARLAP